MTPYLSWLNIASLSGLRQMHTSNWNVELLCIYVFRQRGTLSAATTVLIQTDMLYVSVTYGKHDFIYTFLSDPNVTSNTHTYHMQTWFQTYIPVTYKHDFMYPCQIQTWHQTHIPFTFFHMQPWPYTYTLVTCQHDIVHIYLLHASVTS